MSSALDPRLRIRPATAADVPSVLDMLGDEADVRQVAPQESAPLVEASIEAWLARADRSFVMTRDDRILGFAALLRDQADAGRWWLGHVVIETRSRGMGLGQSFVKALLRTATAIEGLEELRLSAFRDNPGARRAYFRCGFREVTRWREGDRTLCEMRWVNPRRQRGPSRAVLAGLGFVAASISAILLPFGARVGFLEVSPWLVGGLLFLGGSITAAFAWIYYRVLPRATAPLSQKLGRPILFGALVGLSSASVLGAILVVANSLGWLELDITVRVWVTRFPGSGLQHGAAWGLVLLIARDLAPHALGWRRRSGPMRSDVD